MVIIVNQKMQEIFMPTDAIQQQTVNGSEKESKRFTTALDTKHL